MRRKQKPWLTVAYIVTYVVSGIVFTYIMIVAILGFLGELD